MARITVNRVAEWTHKLRDVHIIIDGTDFAKLKNGQQKVLHLPPGEHEIQAKMSWFGSKKHVFKLNDDGGLTSFSVKGYKYARFTNITTICVAPLYFIFLIPYTGLFLTMASAILIYLLYMLLFGRHKYLEIERVSEA